MATNVDKTMNPAPQGIADTPDDGGLEIELLPDGGASVEIEDTPEEIDFDANLAEHMKPGDLAVMASELIEDIDNDDMSRREWKKTYVEGIKLLGLTYEDRMEPWDGACGVVHPMITEAVVKFQSEASTETFPAQGPVRTKIVGKETRDKKDAAARVEHDMNHELTDVMKEYRPEHERMLWSLPATGSAFKKVYYDPNIGRQTALFVPAEDIILPYGSTDLDTCHRVTHVMRKTPNDIRKLIAAGFYRNITIADVPQVEREEIQDAKDKETGFSDLNDERHTMYESHVDRVLKGFDDEASGGDGLARPYVITMLKGTNEVLAVRRNWKEADKLKLKRQHFVHYQYIPGFGAYGFGLFHLIGGFAKSATSIIRQLVDAGTLSNLPGGLKSKGLRIKGDDTPIAPGEFRDVDVGSGTIKDNVMSLPYKEPSAVLAALLEQIVEEGRRFAATADLQVSDMSASAPVGTTLALLERQLKVMSAIQSRLHYTLKQELGLIADIIRDYTDPNYEYDPDGADEEKPNRHAKQADYRFVEIIPVSDPNASTMSQRIIQYQAVIQLSTSAPQIYDLKLLHRGMLEVLGMKNANKLIPLDEDQKPKDPVTENMGVLKGKPVKAFMHQDHESHIKVHMSAMTDPIIQQLIGQNPQAQQIQSAMYAHIAEHVGYAYRQKIEQQLGMALPPEDENLPPEVELGLSNMMAQAAQQVLQASQTQAAQMQAQQAAQDPVLQLQQKDQQIKEKEVALKEKKIIGDLAAKSDEIEIKKQKLGLDDSKATADTLLKLRESQANAGDPAQAAQHAEELHQQELATNDATTQQQLQQRARQQEQQDAEIKRKARLEAFAAAQAGTHKHEVHTQKLRQQEEAHKARLAAQAKQAAMKPAPKKEDK